MAVHIKTPEEIDKMRTSGRLAAQVLEMIGPHVQPGTTTDELNDLCHHYITEVQQAVPAPLNYRGFPKSICTSINHQVCHGIPNDRPLKSGDILNIDVTVIKDGFHGDTSKMFLLDGASIKAQRLSRVTQECLYLAIQTVKPGAHLGDIGAVIQSHAEKHHYSIVREYCGHGIGRVFHEDPQVLHYVQYEAPANRHAGRTGLKAKPGLRLEEGMIFTIEPMINAGKRETKLLKDNWTVETRDRSLSAQWEHTILVTATGFEILTLRAEEDGAIARQT